MNRRNFLKNTIPFGIMPLIGTGLPMRALSATSSLFANPCNVTDRSIVIVYLNGGNDIFNTNVPLNQFSDYANLRPNLYIPQNSLITLDSSLPSDQQLGLHPSLTPMKDLYDSGKMSIIQGVGYQNNNRSHFKSLENWLQGSGGTEKYNNGWLGRFFDDRYPSYTGLPFLNEPDPLAMMFGRMNNAGFHTHEQHSHEITMSGQDSSGLYSVISTLTGEPILNIPNSDHGDMLTFLDGVAASLNVYAGRVQQVFNAGTNDGNVVYPSTSLGNQLKTVSKMLSGGSRTKIFAVSKGGFDNHVNIVDAPNSVTGTHANLLTDTFGSIKAFQDDLAAQGLEDNVLTMVFSEFGRKISQNGSMGVDHGTLSNVFIVGKGVEPGVIGNNMDLTNLSGGAPAGSQLQHSYHTIYATLLQDWLGANNNSIDNGIFYRASSPYSAQKVNLINNNNIVPSHCYFTPTPVTACACMQVKIILEGFYNVASGEMSTSLASSTGFPNTQPYGVSPFNYSGTENFSTAPTDHVDWLLIELRKAEDLSIVVERQAVLLRKDGFIMQADGTPGLNFPNVAEGDYHLAIFHRNHLALLSSEIVELDNASFIYDFTAGVTKAYGTNQLILKDSKYMMIAGDISANHTIDNKDYNYIEQNKSPNVGYSTGDLNGDEQIDNSDYDLWFQNRYKMGEVD